MDRMTAAARSALMAKVTSKNTSPELSVRRLAFSMGYRYRLHRRHLPGSPDIVFPSRRRVIFVHGCFWHRHQGCAKAGLPKSRTDFWSTKFARNVERDAKAVAALGEAGWSVLIIWQCEMRDEQVVRNTLKAFLDA